MIPVDLSRADAFVEGSTDTLIALESMLTAIPAISPESGGEGELDKCLALEAWLRERGFTALERHDAPDPRAKGGVRPSLVLTLPGKNEGPCLWIMSHLDVVPSGDRALWSRDPFTVHVEGGKLYGRGVEDNQQGLCASVLAALAVLDGALAIKDGALAVKDGSIGLPSTVKLLFVADEEMGSEYGIQWLLENRELFRDDDLVLIPDGGDSEGSTIEIAEKNLLWLRFTIRGQQAHGSRPDQGKNAQLAASDLTMRLYAALHERFDARDELFDPPVSTFEPTKVEANVPNINTIPGEAVFAYDMRILPRYALKEVLALVRNVCDTLEADRGVRVSYESLQAVESPATPADSPLVARLSRAVKEVYGLATRPIGIGGGTVASYLRKRGIHAAVWGKLDEMAHQADEYAIIDNILSDAKVMLRLMTRP